MTDKEELSRGDALAKVAVLEAEVAELRGRVCVPEGWTLDKPTVPGAYWVRGNGLPEALVVVKCDEGELWCNLHMSTTEQNFGYGFTVEQLDDSFEWLGPLAATPQPTAAPSRDAIRATLMAHGFTVKIGQTDLKDYVYEAVEALFARSAPAAQDVAGLVDFAVRSWHEQVANRPLQNVYRRTLDSVWRQVIRFAGEDDVVLIGPRHDDMLDESGNPLPQYAAHQSGGAK